MKHHLCQLNSKQIFTCIAFFHRQCYRYDVMHFKNMFNIYMSSFIFLEAQLSNMLIGLFVFTKCLIALIQVTMGKNVDRRFVPTCRWFNFPKSTHT